jgi:hypothetical protein
LIYLMCSRLGCSRADMFHSVYYERWEWAAVSLLLEWWRLAML